MTNTIAANNIAAELVRRLDVPRGVAAQAATELAAQGYQSNIVRNATRVNGASRYVVAKALDNAGWVVETNI